MVEAEPEEVPVGKVQVESLKYISSSNPVPASKGTPTILDGFAIHESLERTYQEKSSRRTTYKKFTIGARISVKPPYGWEKKYLADPEYAPKLHPIRTAVY